jgi:hypothetical protein
MLRIDTFDAENRIHYPARRSGPPFSPAAAARTLGFFAGAGDTFHPIMSKYARSIWPAIVCH